MQLRELIILAYCSLIGILLIQRYQMLKGTKKLIQSILLQKTVTQVITLGLIVSAALMIWNSVVLITGCKSPFMVVLSGSMEPGFKRGDVLFLNLKKAPFYAGEIVVFRIEGWETRIVHRVIKAHRRVNSDEVNLVTKGDNNVMDDSYGIYAKDQLFLENDHIIGRVKGYLPYVGYATIILTEQPLIKYLAVGGLSILAINSS